MSALGFSPEDNWPCQVQFSEDGVDSRVWVGCWLAGGDCRAQGTVRGHLSSAQYIRKSPAGTEPAGREKMGLM